MQRITSSALAQDGGPVLRVIFQVGVDFPIEVVQQAGQGPVIRVAAEFDSVAAHGGLHRQHVLDEAFVFDVLFDDGVGGISIHRF